MSAVSTTTGRSDRRTLLIASLVTIVLGLLVGAIGSVNMINEATAADLERRSVEQSIWLWPVFLTGAALGIAGVILLIVATARRSVTAG
jgi:hypothetical protein